MFGFSRTFALVVVLLAVAWVGTIPAHAVTLTFEDLRAAADRTADGSFYHVPNGYGGLNWNNFNAMDTLVYPTSPSGYRYGAVSGSVVLYNAFGDPATVLQTATPIILHSAYLTGAWNDGLSVRANGYLGSVLRYSRTVTVSAHDPTLVSYEFSDVDRVVWTSWGGVSAGFGGSGTFFAMDDLSFDVVPEPSSLLVLLSCVGGLGGLAWRRRHAHK